MSQQQQMGGQPMVILGEDSQRMKDRDAQSHNIAAAQAVSESVRSTLGPKGMDKMLVSSMGDVTVTNDGVTILGEMDIDNPTASMVVEVAETQEDEAGDGTTTAVSIAGELLSNAEDMLEQDIHPTAIIRGFDLAAEQAREEIDEVSRTVDPDDTDLIRSVAETSMTGKGAELEKDVLAELVVDAVQAVTVDADDGETVVDLEYVNVETQTGSAAGDSELLEGAVIDKDPAHAEMPTSLANAEVLLIDEPIEVEDTDADANLQLDSPDQLQNFLDKEEEQLREKVETIAESGADVVFCQKGIDDLAEHFLAQEGVLAASRAKKSDLAFLREIVGAEVVSDLDTLASGALGAADVRFDDEEELFYVEGTDEESHGVTLLLRGSTDHVVDELERGIGDALDVVAQCVSDGRVLAGGGAVEVEVARRVREFADGVSGREQRAVKAFADALELVPRVLS
ncbi:thermosome subunit, partial [Halobacteriales archaeon QS_9_70_65]